MRMIPVLMALLAVQVSASLEPSEIMKHAAARSIRDTKMLKETYDYDMVRANPPKKSRCKNPDDGNVQIPELFGPDRYVYALVGNGTELNGREMHVIEFSPKSKRPEAPRNASGCQKIKNDALNHLKGIVYVDKEDFGIARVVTEVHDPPAKILGVGRLYQMDVTIDQFRLGDIWAPEEISIKNKQSVFLGFIGTNEEGEQVISFKNFRPKAP